eukprot:1148786-Pelagomonas_calceolata.AAC.2
MTIHHVLQVSLQIHLPAPTRSRYLPAPACSAYGLLSLGRNLSPMPQPRQKHTLVTTGEEVVRLVDMENNFRQAWEIQTRGLSGVENSPQNRHAFHSSMKQRCATKHGSSIKHGCAMTWDTQACLQNVG